MEIYQFKCWCEKAASGIIFPPDQKKVYRELMDHMEDHCDYLMEQGIDCDTAQQMTVDAMGDAYEIAPQLAAIHRPFWGYFLRATRVLLVFLACCAVILGLPFAYNSRYSYPNGDREPPYENAVTRLLCTEPTQTTTSDGYTLTLTYAAWHHPASTDKSSSGQDVFCFEIEVFNPRPWAGYPDINDWFWAEDSLGNHYYALWENIYYDEPRITGSCYRSGLLSYTLDMRVNNICSQDAQWLDIHYDRAGRNILFRIDLTGGDSP